MSILWSINYSVRKGKIRKQRRKWFSRSDESEKGTFCIRVGMDFSTWILSIRKKSIYRILSTFIQRKLINKDTNDVHCFIVHCMYSLFVGYNVFNALYSSLKVACFVIYVMWSLWSLCYVVFDLLDKTFWLDSDVVWILDFTNTLKQMFWKCHESYV